MSQCLLAGRVSTCNGEQYNKLALTIDIIIEGFSSLSAMGVLKYSAQETKGFVSFRGNSVIMLAP